jgi:hypothetical protein
VNNLLTLNVEQPDKALFEKAEYHLKHSREFLITSGDGMTAASDELGRIKSLYKTLEEKRTSIVKPLGDATKKINDLFRDPLRFLKDAENALKGAMLGFRQQQDRLAREQQAKLDAEAKAERERLAQKAAETERQAKEAAGNGLPAGLAAALERRAAVQAMELREQAKHVIAPTVVPPPLRTQGISTRESWQFEIVDASLLPREYLVPDEKKIRQVVNAMKDRTAIPGVRVTRGEIVASRSA